MHKSFFFGFLFLLVLLSAACNNVATTKHTADADTSLIEVPTGMRIVPEFSSIDSVQILYYKDPFGKDSLRYYRYFTYLASNDTSVVHIILQALKQPVKGTVQKTCRSEGKMYLLQHGSIIKTVYFNLQPGNCNHLYFIKDGNFYYLPVSDTLSSVLQQLRKKAAAPPAGSSVAE